MKKRISELSVLQTGIVLGALYAAFGLVMLVVFLPLGLIMAITGAVSDAEAPGLIGGVGMVFMGVFFPVFYGVVGFIGGLLLALIYNLIAKYTGGLEITLSDVTTPVEAAPGTPAPASHPE
jgi:hypothetical protein